MILLRQRKKRGRKKGKLVMMVMRYANKHKGGGGFEYQVKSKFLSTPLLPLASIAYVGIRREKKKSKKPNFKKQQRADRTSPAQPSQSVPSFPHNLKPPSISHRIASHPIPIPILNSPAARPVTLLVCLFVTPFVYALMALGPG